MGDGSGDRLVAKLVPAPPGAEPRPLVLLVHGLGGSSESGYVAVTTAHLHERGFSVLQLNLRGAGESRPLCREQYHAGRTQDFRDAVGALPEPLVANGVVAVGYSLGGNLVLKAAAEFGGLRGVVSVSAPIDLKAASYRFLAPRNWGYHRYLLTGMKRECRAAPGGLSEDEERRLGRIRTILEFDEHIVAPRGGFDGALDYYAKNNAKQFLSDIRIPALVVHALDDPWIPAESYVDYPWAQNPVLEPLLSAGGGHVGFHGQDARIPWHDRCIAAFLDRHFSGAY